MLVCWALVLCSLSVGVLAASSPRRDPLPLTLLVSRDRRAINSKPSNIFWVYPRLSPASPNLDSENRFLSKIFNIKRRARRAVPSSEDVTQETRKTHFIKRRARRGFPSSDDVSETDVAQWTRKAAPKTDFITGREHKSTESAPDAKHNEVEPPGFRPRSSNQPLTNRDFGVDSREGERFHQPHRRIIYYANLPDITSRDRSNVYRRYEPVPPGPKYPRESSYEARGRSNPLDYDRYSYRPADRTHSYTIVDAEVPRSNGYELPYARGYQGGYPGKYSKIPAPYRQGDYPARPREPLGSQGATMVRNEPYRDYNPRQPAPWSVQIGTKLTVKDDGRPFRPDVGQRRFYVNSQEPPRYNRVDRSRYDYST